MVVKYLGVPVPEHPHVHFPNEDIQVLHLGRLIDFKSPDRTIKAFEISRSLGMGGRLVIAGDGPLRTTCELLRQRSKWKDSIHILGSVSWQQAQNLLRESDIFTQHNIYGEISRQSEALGVSILEAMSYSLPIVGTKHGGVLETVVDGVNGILIEPGDVQAQAEAIYKLSKDSALRQVLGNAGRERVAKNFGFEQESRVLYEIMNISNTTV